MAQKYVYFFGNGKAEGKGDMKNVLGGKGAGLAEMTSIGLPVPAGFTISVDACVAYDEGGRKMPKGLDKEVLTHMARLEKASGKKFGDREDPLLVSVRSGPRAPCPA
jgi:pyruvate,orthophosphate dikinase